MSLRLIGITLLTLLLSTSLVSANEKTGQKITRLLDTLYEKPDASLKGYDSVYVSKLDLDDARLVPPAWVDLKEKRLKDWELNESNAKFLRDAYREAMKEEIAGNNGYPVVTDYGKGVLVISISILKFTPYAARGEKVITKGSGELVVQVRLSDGATGDLLGIYQGTQPVGEEYNENTRMSTEKNLKELFTIWASQARKLLDNAHNK